jgi:hypothetical protein
MRQAAPDWRHSTDWYMRPVRSTRGLRLHDHRAAELVLTAAPSNVARPARHVDHSSAIAETALIARNATLKRFFRVTSAARHGGRERTDH